MKTLRFHGFLFFFRFQRSLRAFYLGVIGFTTPPGGGKKLLRAFSIGSLQRGAAIVTEIEFRVVAVKMGFAATLIDTNRAAIEKPYAS